MRRIKKVTVQQLSLCKRGKNRLPVLYKSEDGSAHLQAMVKALDDFDEKGELLIVGYAPELRDVDGDIADADLCREMGHSFMREGAKLDIRHDGNIIERQKAYVAESFTIQKSDERFANWKDYDGTPVDVTGGWGALIKIEDPALRALYKSEGWNGVSFEGPAIVVEEQPDWANRLTKAVDFIKGKLGITEPGEPDDMNAQELEAALKKSNEGLLEGLKGILVPAQAAPKPEPKAGDPLVFEGDPLKKEDVAAHQQKVRLAKMDWNDEAKVSAYLAELEKAQGPGDDDDDDDADDERPLRKADRRSEQPVAPVAPRNQKVPEHYSHLRLSKAEIDGCESAKRMAAYMNQGKV